MANDTISTGVIVPGRVNGIDICPSIQAKVDWSLVKAAGFDFVYIQSSRYSSTAERGFYEARAAAEKAGLHVGAYHFCSYDSDPIGQARHFYKSSGACGAKPGELPPMADWEFCTPSKYRDHPGHCVSWIESFTDACDSLWYPADQTVRRSTAVYTYPYYAKAHQPALGASGILGRRPLWLASYGPTGGIPDASHVPYAPIPEPWRNAVLWQYSGSNGRSVPGVDGECDRSVYLGSDFDGFLGLPAKAAVNRPVDSMVYPAAEYVHGVHGGRV